MLTKFLFGIPKVLFSIPKNQSLTKNSLRLNKFFLVDQKKEEIDWIIGRPRDWPKPHGRDNDLKSSSLKFGNDTFITFEMPRVSYKRPVGKMNISLLFRPSVIRGPWPISILTLFQDKPSNFNKQPFSAHIPMTSCNKIFSLPLCIRSIKIAHNHCSPTRVAAIWKCIYSLNNNWWDLG